MLVLNKSLVDDVIRRANARLEVTTYPVERIGVREHESPVLHALIAAILEVVLEHRK